MKPRFHRPERQAHHVRDLGERKPLDMVQDDDRPLIDAQAAEASLQLIAIGHLRELVKAGRVVEWQLADLRRPLAPLATGLTMAGPDKDAVKPGLESIGLPKCGEISPSGDECVLSDVGGTVRVADDQLGNAVQPTDLPLGELVERGRITGHCAFHELSIHSRSPCCGHHGQDVQRWT